MVRPVVSRMAWHVIVCYAMSWHAMLWHSMLCHTMLWLSRSPRIYTPPRIYLMNSATQYFHLCRGWGTGGVGTALAQAPTPAPGSCTAPGAPPAASSLHNFPGFVFTFIEEVEIKPLRLKLSAFFSPDNCMFLPLKDVCTLHLTTASCPLTHHTCLLFPVP